MTISDIVSNTHGRAGSGGAWRVERDWPAEGVATLWHYATAMLRWRIDQPDDPEWLCTSTGHGSVSDQGGMNQAFKTLGLPLYFTRQGGAAIVPVPT